MYWLFSRNFNSIEFKKAIYQKKDQGRRLYAHFVDGRKEVVQLTSKYKKRTKNHFWIKTDIILTLKAQNLISAKFTFCILSTNVKINPFPKGNNIFPFIPPINQMKYICKVCSLKHENNSRTCP